MRLVMRWESYVVLLYPGLFQLEARDSMVSKIASFVNFTLCTDVRILCIITNDNNKYCYHSNISYRLCLLHEEEDYFWSCWSTFVLIVHGLNFAQCFMFPQVSPSWVDNAHWRLHDTFLHCAGQCVLPLPWPREQPGDIPRGTIYAGYWGGAEGITLWRGARDRTCLGKSSIDGIIIVDFTFCYYGRKFVNQDYDHDPNVGGDTLIHFWGDERNLIAAVVSISFQ